MVFVMLFAALWLLGTAQALAACNSCHFAGSTSAPDPALHPVPPAPAWDVWDGQCTICHEVSDAIIPGGTEWPDYQDPPLGGFPLPEIYDHFLIPEESLYCSDCHTTAHGRAVVWSNSGYWNPATVTIDLSGATEDMCVGCHTTGMAYPTDALAPAYVPQVNAATHGDPTAAHAAMWDPACVNQCHGSDPVAAHPGGCETCHPGGAAAPAGATCTTICHPDYHTNATSTPASSPWSLALVAPFALGVALAVRRVRATA